MRLYEFLSPRDISDIEKELNSNVYNEPKALGAKAPPIKLELPTRAHFMDRIKQRSDAQNISGEEIASLLARARLDPKLGVSKVIDQKAKANEPEGDIVVRDPKTSLRIPFVFEPNQNCVQQNFVDGVPFCKVRSGGKEAKNKMIAKTIYRDDMPPQTTASMRSGRPGTGTGRPQQRFREDRVDELKPSNVKALSRMSNDTTHPDELADYLTKNGFTELGSGAFSTVYSQPNSNAVVKVIKLHGDKCWLTFAEYTKEHPSKFYPKISGINVYRNTREGGNTEEQPVYYCLMEKLVRLYDVPLNQKTAPMFAALDLYHDMDFHGFQTWKKYLKKYIPTDALYGDVIKIVKEKQLKLISKYKDYEGFKEALKNIKDYSESHGCKGDLHEGNIMYRPSTNTLVIVDPVYDPVNFDNNRGW